MRKNILFLVLAIMATTASMARGGSKPDPAAAGQQTSAATDGTEITTSSAQSATHYMAVVSDLADIRKAPSRESQVLAKVPRGAWLAIIGRDNGWAIVQGKDFDGYVDQSQLGEIAPLNAPATSRSSHQSATAAPQPQPQPPVQNYPSSQGTPATPTYQVYPTTPTYLAYPSLPKYQTTSPYEYQTGLPANQYPPTGQVYAPETRVVNSGGGTIHENPDPRSQLLSILPPGYQVQVLGTIDGDWAHIVANGIEGYIKRNQLQ
jgi:SH3-like domain-containing protein